MGKDLVLANIYGPNKDEPPFFENIKNKIEELDTPNIILAGDWNLVLNPNLDYHNYKHVNNIRAQEVVIEMMSKLELVDIWRELNHEVSRYTWRRPNPLQQSRLDFFLVSDTLITNIRDTDILFGYRSDHSLIHININFKKEERHKGFWKFNSSLLRDKKYVDLINDTIERIKRQYALLPYERNSIGNISNDQIQFSISDQLFLDTLIMEIRAQTISYSINKNKDKKHSEKNLEKDIQSLENRCPLSEADAVLLKVKKEELIELRKTKMDGIILRSKAKWASQGEKITKYFCSLEKRNFVSKQMLKLITDQGDTLTETENMLQETNFFYETLYTERKIQDFELENYVTDLPKLSKMESDQLEGQITLEEASKVLKNMQNDKSPGTDGMTVNFLKVFWKQLGHFVVRSLNEGFTKGEMSVTQKEGIIICLPKGDKPREYLKNWRPISLLNVTYKIGTACIANRIKIVLPRLINEDQSGFVPGRYIGDSLRTIYDIIHYLEAKQLSGLLVSIDFEKAFDSVNWTYMSKVMQIFGFGKGIQRWVASFYEKIKSYVIVNGKVSSSFHIERGCRQGDPISPYLFVLCAEVLACKIREDKDIKGIQIADTVFKVTQFADDTSFTLEGDRESYEKLFKTLDTFENMSGLKLNYGKTTNVWLGKKKKSATVYLPHNKMEWNPKQFKILGLWFTNDLSNMTEINVADTFLEVKILFKIWSKRMITPMGRVAVLKSLVLSKLVYLWILLPNPPDSQIKQLQNMCYEFVWDKKTDKIKRKYSVQNIKKGGIGIPNVKVYIQSLKISWVKKTYTQNRKWRVILQSLCPEIDLFDVYGPKRFYESKVNKFWTDVFIAYDNFCKQVDLNKSEELAAEPIFYNDKFRVGDKFFHYRKWKQNNVFLVKHLLDDNGMFVGCQALSEKLGFVVNFLDYISCTQSIKKYAGQKKIKLDSNKSNDRTTALQTISSVKKGSKVYYDIMLEKIDVFDIKAFVKWEENLNTQIGWEDVLKQITKIKEIKLKWFQVRICHRILVTNSILNRMKVTDSDRCNFCNNEKDTINHYLWECQFTLSFWRDLENILKTKCLHCERLSLNVELVLFGTEKNTKTDDILDLIILQGNFFVYKCRINKIKPNVNEFLRELKYKHEIEKNVHLLEMQYLEFQRKWFPYIKLIKI